MAVATVPSDPDKLLLNQSGRCLLEICERLRLSPHRYGNAEERYVKMSDARATKGGLLGSFKSRTDPQGAMHPGTMVKSIDPHDPDFVYRLSKSHAFVKSIKLIDAFYFHLKQYVPKHGMLSIAHCLQHLALQFSRPKLRSCPLFELRIISSTNDRLLLERP